MRAIFKKDVNIDFQKKDISVVLTEDSENRTGTQGSLIFGPSICPWDGDLLIQNGENSRIMTPKLGNHISRTQESIFKLACIKYSHFYFQKYFTLTDLAKYALYEVVCQKLTNCILIIFFLKFPLTRRNMQRHISEKVK